MTESNSEAEQSNTPNGSVKLAQKVIIQHPRGKRFFLALKRSDHDEVRPGDWDLPGGGVDFGEDVLEALFREVHEETGLEITEAAPVAVHSNHKKEANLHIIKICYVAHASRSDVVLSEEHVEFEWMDAEEFAQKCKAPYLIEAVDAAFGGR